MTSLHFYLKDGDRVLRVDDAPVHVEHERALRIDRCRLVDVAGVGGGMYDMIVFPKLPPEGILRKAIEKIYWGGYVVIFGYENAVEEIGFQIVKGNPGVVVLRRPPLPDAWSKEYFLRFPKGGEEWDPISKTMHRRYRTKFDAIDAKWDGATVLEYGCGRGEITRLIALAGARRIYGIDTSPAAVAMTLEFCGDLENVGVFCADAVQWKSPEKCDVVVAIDFVEHIREEDLPQLWSAMRDNLKPGGTVHIVTPLGPDHVRDHKWAPSPSKLREKMESAGFKYKRHVRPGNSRKFMAEFVK